jgi:hypothetical protein
MLLDCLTAETIRADNWPRGELTHEYIGLLGLHINYSDEQQS